MMRALIAALLLLGAAPAFAQGPGMAGSGGAGMAWNHYSGGCALTGCTYTGALVTVGITDSGGLTETGTTTTAGITDSGGINTTAAGGYEAGGVNAYSVITPTTTIPGLRLGPYAGASLTSTTYGMVAIGPGTMGLLTNGNAETVGVGVRACGAMVAGNNNVCMGESALGADDASNATVIGNDAARDSTGITGSTLLGIQDMTDGSGLTNTVIGGLSLHGTAGTIKIAAGTLHTGDTYPITFTTTSSNTTITTATMTYTVLNTDTVATMAANIAGQMLTLGISFSAPAPAGMNFPATGLGTVTNADILGNWYIGLHIQTSAALTMTVGSCTGTCSVVMTATGASATVDNVIVGSQVLRSVAIGAAIENVLMGDYIGTNATGAYQQNVVGGYEAHYQATNDQRDVVFGQLAGYHNQGTSDEILLGFEAGMGITTGVQNIVIESSQSNGANCITTGNTNVEIGYGACVPSATSNNQLSIMDAIYGGSNNKGAGGGYGWICMYCTSSSVSGNAALTISDAAGGNTSYGAHFGVIQTTAPTITTGTATVDSHASDVAGTVTEGATQTGFTLTFNVAWKTTPHCVVTSPSGSALTSYTVGTTTLAVANASATGDVFSYVCVQ